MKTKTPKMGFCLGQTRPYHTWDFKDQFGLKLGRTRREERRGEEEEEEEKKRRSGDQAKIKAKKVWMLGF